MQVLLLLAAMYASFAIHKVFNLGLMELILAMVGLIGLPYIASQTLFTRAGSAFFDEIEGKPVSWLFRLGGLGIVIAIYYAIHPTIAAIYPYGPPPPYGTAATATSDAVGLWSWTASTALTLGYGAYIAVLLLLDWCGLLRAMHARISGQTPPHHRLYPPSALVESTPDLGGFDPRRFDRHAPPPPPAMTITRDSDSVVAGPDYSQERQGQTLH